MSASPFHDLASQVSSSDVRDPAVQEKIRRQILGLRKDLHAAPAELVACLDAAATLVGSLPHLDQRVASEVQSMVLRLVDLVERAGRIPGQEPAPEPRATVQLELEATVDPEPQATVDPDPQATVDPDPLATVDPDPPATVDPEPLATGAPTPTPQAPDSRHPLDLAARVTAEPARVPPPVEAPDVSNPPTLPPPARPTRAPSARSRSVDYSVPKLNDMMLGEVMVQLGFVTQEDVDAALKAMAEKGYKFGEALILSGAASAEDVAQGISLQRMLSQGQQRASQQSSKFDRASVLHGILLGEILVLMNRITREQLQRGLEHQRHTGSRIGEALIELGFIGWEDLDEAINIQYARGGSSELNDSSTVVRLDGD